MDMPHFGIPPQSLIMESIWITNWMQRLLKLQAESASSGDKIVFCDRSPYSAVYYAGKKGILLEPLIRQQIEDLRTFANIHICTVSLKVTAAFDGNDNYGAGAGGGGGALASSPND